MLQNILNLEGVAVLSKERQKNVNGGYRQPNVLAPLNPGGGSGLDTRCRVLLADGSGGIINFSGAETGAQVSAAANAWCTNAVINSGAGSCKYDCYYDGKG